MKTKILIFLFFLVNGIILTTFAATIITSWPPGDINGDCEVDLPDLVFMGEAWGSSPGDENWNEDVDLNCDEKIDLLDLGTLGQNWGDTCSG